MHGETLFRTLMLNLHQYNPVSGIPFDSRVDRLAWERADETRATERHPDGYLDWLTWQSRRVRVFRASDVGDDPAVSTVFYVKGHQPPAKFWPSRSEVMMAFQPKPTEGLKKSPEADPAIPIRFRRARGLWRDSMALLEHGAGEYRRPRIFDWLSTLVAAGLLDERYPLSIAAYGMCSDQAKVLYWRHEQLPLPLAYFRDARLREEVHRALRLAEGVGRALHNAAFAFAEHAFPDVIEMGTPQERRKETEARRIAFAPGRRYWPALDAPFSGFLAAHVQERTAVAAPLIFGTAFGEWERRVAAAAETDLWAMFCSVADTARVFRARAIAAAVYVDYVNRARTHAGLPMTGTEDAMVDVTRREYAFVARLLRYARNRTGSGARGSDARAALAAMRRGLGKRPGEAPEMFRYVVRYLPTQLRA